MLWLFLMLVIVLIIVVCLLNACYIPDIRLSAFHVLILSYLNPYNNPKS